MDKPKNQCALCFLDFASSRAFDKHKVGVHAYTFAEGMRLSPPRENGRRCLDVDEMRGKGFVQNAYGRWTLAKTLAGAPRRLQGNPVPSALHVSVGTEA